MTYVQPQTFQVTDRLTGAEKPLTFGVEGGLVVCQGPRSWHTGEVNATAIAAGLLLVIEAAARSKRGS